MRLASANERERDEWLHVLGYLNHYTMLGLEAGCAYASLTYVSDCRFYFAEHQQSPAEVLSLSPTYIGTTLSPSRSSIRHKTSGSMPPATAGEIVRDLARDTLAASEPASLLRVKTTSGRSLVHVDDSITVTRKVCTRYRTAVPTRPMSRWSEEGLDVRKEQWMAEVTKLRARGEDTFSATEALHKGIPYARRGTLVDALSKSAYVEDAHILQVRRTSCHVIERELQQIDSQVQQMHKELDSPKESPTASRRASQSSDDDLFAEFNTERSIWANTESPSMRRSKTETHAVWGGGSPSQQSRVTTGTSDFKNMSVEERMCYDTIKIFPKRWVENASNDVGGILKWRALSYVDQLAAIYTAMRDANDIGQVNVLMCADTNRMYACRCASQYLRAGCLILFSLAWVPSMSRFSRMSRVPIRARCQSQ